MIDRAGNQVETSAGSIDLPPETPPLVITEVLANPAGPEPGQEFVELRNLGGADLSLGGLRLEDAKGADVLPEATLVAGAYALIVPSTFDPGSPRDVPPRAGTLMVPVDTRLGVRRAVEHRRGGAAAHAGDRDRAGDLHLRRLGRRLGRERRRQERAPAGRRVV